MYKYACRVRAVNSSLGYTDVVSKRSSDSYFFSSLFVATIFAHERKFSGLCSAKSGLYHLDLGVMMMMMMMSGR